MLADLHAHSGGISRCCRATAPEILLMAKEKGIGAIVLTNHYQKCYLENDDANAFAEKYIKEYLYTAECSKKLGMRVYFGLEVTPEFATNVHLLIYDVSTDFVRSNPGLWELSQKELYELVHKNGGVMFQAHPFRNGADVLDHAYLDGIEVNCHPVYKKSYCERILAIAGEKNIAVSCGGDFHNDTYRPVCGVYLPDDLNDDFKVGAYVANARHIKLCVHEPYAEKHYDIDFFRK